MRCLFLLFLVPLSIDAEVMNLEDAEGIAEENNTELKAIRREVSIANESVKSRFREFFPQVSVSYRQNRSVAKRDFDNGNHSVQLSITQPLYDGGRSSLSLEIAELDVRIASEKYQSLKRNLKLNVRQLYFKAQQALYQKNIAILSLRNTKDMLEKARVELSQDAISKIDFAELSNEYERRRLSLEAEEASFEDALTELALLLRIPRDSDIEIADINLDALRFAELEIDDASLLRLALQTKPEIRDARLAVFKNERQKKISERHYLPTVSLTGHYGKTGNQWPPKTAEYGVGISITLPLFGNTIRNDSQFNRSREDTSTAVSSGGSVDLFDNPGYAQAEMQSELSLYRSKIQERDIHERTILDIARFRREFLMKSNSIKLEKESIEIQETRLKIMMLQYQSGELTLHDYILEEIKWIQASFASIQHRAEILLFVNAFENSLGLGLDSLGLVSLDEAVPRKLGELQPEPSNLKRPK